MCIWIKTANKIVLRDRSREQTLNLISGLEREWQKIPWASQTGKNLAWDKRLKLGFIQLPVLLKGWNHLRFIYSLLDLPTQGFECHWNFIFTGHQKKWHKMLDEESAGGFWLVHQASEQSDILGLRVVLFQIHIISFGALPLLECNVRGFQALSSGANPPVNIDSGFWRTAEKMTSQWALLPSLPVCSSEPSGARRRRNKRKISPNIPKPEALYCCLN